MSSRTSLSNAWLRSSSPEAARVKSVEDGVVTLEASGSPGAIVPAIERIQPLLRAAVPQVTAVHVVWPGQTRPAVPDAATVARIQRVIDYEVNPAVAAERGPVRVVVASGGRVGVT